MVQFCLGLLSSSQFVCFFKILYLFKKREFMDSCLFCLRIAAIFSSVPLTTHLCASHWVMGFVSRVLVSKKSLMSLLIMVVCESSMSYSDVSNFQVLLICISSGNLIVIVIGW